MENPNPLEKRKVEQHLLRDFISSIFIALAFVVLIVIGIWGTKIAFAIWVKVVGPSLTAIFFLLLPLSFAFTPLYALIAWGDIKPFLVNWVGFVVFLILFLIARVIAPEDGIIRNLFRR